MRPVIDLLDDYLRIIGADGLCYSELECGCELGDLSPGGCLHESECVAAINDPDQAVAQNTDFWMVPMEAMRDTPASAFIERLHAENKHLLSAIDRSDIDLSTCNGCGEAVVVLPDGLPYCSACAEGGA